MSGHQFRPKGITLVIGLLVSACAGSGGPSQAPPAQPTSSLRPSAVAATPTARPAATPSAVPAATRATAAPTGPQPLRMGQLDAGIYRTNFFEPQLVFVLPDGWSEFFPDEDDEVYMGAPGAELAISRPAQVRDPETSQPVDVPDDLLSWLLDHPDLNVAEPTPLQIDGIPSSYIEPDATREVRLFVFTGGDFRIGAGNRQRMYVVPLDGPDLAITIIAPQGGELVDAVATAESIVESLEIGD